MSDKKSRGGLFGTKVPEEIVPPFLNTQDYMSKFLAKESRDPTKDEKR